MFFMKYQCPFCESFDVKKNERGEAFCFSCFSVCSDNDIDQLLWGRMGELPPPFPEELERKRTKRFAKSVRGNAVSEIMRRII